MSVFLRKQTINIIIAPFLIHLDRPTYVPTYVCTVKLLTIIFWLIFILILTTFIL